MNRFGLTPLHFYSPKIEYSKFFALFRLLRDVPKDDKGFQWLKVPKNNYADYIGFQITRLKKGGFKFYTKYALELKTSNHEN